jgi:hypothetical protein
VPGSNGRPPACAGRAQRSARTSERVLRRSRTGRPSTAYGRRAAGEVSLRVGLRVAKKVARKSGQIAHELPSDELDGKRAGRKFLQILMIFRVELARPRGFEPLTFGSVGGASTCPRSPIPPRIACTARFLVMTRAATRGHTRSRSVPTSFPPAGGWQLIPAVGAARETWPHSAPASRKSWRICGSAARSFSRPAASLERRMSSGAATTTVSPSLSRCSRAPRSQSV